jgi:nitronate monooxygenase
MRLPSRLPIVQAPMAGGPSTLELTAAVAGAGAFGFLAGAYLTPDALREALSAIRALTSEPIGVNLFVPSSPSAADDAAIAAYGHALQSEADRLGVALGEPRWEDDEYDAKVDLLGSAGVHLTTFTFGAPTSEVVARLHAGDVRVGVTVTSRAEAEVAAERGADLLIVQGTEAGGHQGTFDPETVNDTPLLAALAETASVGLPVIAAGGIMDAHAVRVVLDAGAIGAQVGTALLCTPEAATSSTHRRALLDGLFAETVVTRAFSGRWARGLANRLAREHPDAPGGYPQVHHLTRPLRAAAIRADDPDIPNLWAGTGWRAVRSAPAAEIVGSLAAGL